VTVQITTSIRLAFLVSPAAVLGPLQVPRPAILVPASPGVGNLLALAGQSPLLSPFPTALVSSKILSPHSPCSNLYFSVPANFPTALSLELLDNRMVERLQDDAISHPNLDVRAAFREACRQELRQHAIDLERRHRHQTLLVQLLIEAELRA
jgi:hypothetical protein